jgi:pyruvate dehydrogenase E2 component (dihydrolipoyllysine-residue acetyltransferase)
MATRVLMPKGSDTMTEGKVLKWIKHEGDAVANGDTVVEIETDKVDMEVESMGEGTLRKILVKEGDVVPVGQLLAVIGAPGEDITAMLDGAKPKPPAPAAGDHAPAAQATPPAAQPQPAPAALSAAAFTSALASPPVAVGGRIFASPLARRMAQEKGIDLNRLTGTGPAGRIVRQDVDRAISAGALAAPATAPAAPRREISLPPLPAIPPPGGPDFRDEPLSQMRKTIATRLAQSLGPVPHFYLTVEVDIKRAKELRESANQLDPNLKLTFNDIIIKAVTAALRLHPEVNASFLGDKIRTHNRVHIGVAVAVEGGGLITPVIRDCDRKTLQHISREAKELVARARSRKLQPDEYTGATFSVSNLGMMGIEEFSAVINPPEGAILAVGAVVEKPVVAEHRIEIGYRCRMTLSCDHRVVDGATGAKFLQTLQRILENPIYLAF